MSTVGRRPVNVCITLWCIFLVSNCLARHRIFWYTYQVVMPWFVYVARCSDMSLYTGITLDLKRREKEHNHNNRIGAKSLRSKRPVTIIYWEEYTTRSEASKREMAVKRLTRKEKLQLLESGPVAESRSDRDKR